MCWRNGEKTSMAKDLGIQAEWLGRDAGIGLHKALETSINLCFFLRAMKGH